MPAVPAYAEADDRVNDTEFPMDMLYGVLSVVSQFSSMLRERRQE